MFAYCNNNPVKYKDVDGYILTTCVDDANPTNDFFDDKLGGPGTGEGHYHYKVNFSIATRSSLTKGGLYNCGVETNSYVTAPTSTNTGTNATTNLYRAMSPAEANDVLTNNKFLPYDYAMEEKWFATNVDDAGRWGDIFYPDGNYNILQVNVNTNSLDSMYHVVRLDGIGEAYCSSLDVLSSSVNFIKKVK